MKKVLIIAIIAAVVGGSIGVYQYTEHVRQQQLEARIRELGDSLLDAIDKAIEDRQEEIDDFVDSLP